MNAKAMTYHWDELPVDHPMEMVDRRRITGQKMMISHITLRQGCHVPRHSHENEQFAMVVSGRVRFELQEAGPDSAREVVLGPGETIHLPSHVVHGAIAEETSVLLDVFSPVIETTGVDQHGSP